MIQWILYQFPLTSDANLFCIDIDCIYFENLYIVTKCPFAFQFMYYLTMGKNIKKLSANIWLLILWKDLESLRKIK